MAKRAGPNRNITVRNACTMTMGIVTKLAQEDGHGFRRALRDERVVARNDRARRIVGDERDAVRLALRCHIRRLEGDFPS